MQEKNQKANAAFAARKQKAVTRNPLKETPSANNIVHNDVNAADLQKQISDLKEIVCTHVLKSKKEECYNSLFSDSTNDSHNNTLTVIIYRCVMLHNTAAGAFSMDPLPLVLTYLNTRTQLRCGFQ